jgi:hypothetical protein
MKAEKLSVAFSILSLLCSAVCYFFLPETIPTHWGVNGQADAWGNRANVFWLGASPLLIALTLLAVPKRGGCLRIAKLNVARTALSPCALRYSLSSSPGPRLGLWLV